MGIPFYLPDYESCPFRSRAVNGHLQLYNGNRKVQRPSGYPNGTNFIASDKELLQNISNWNQHILTEALVKERISWTFDTPSAPHYDGVWERVVRSFKNVFYAVLGDRRLFDEILITTFCLVEQSLIARPLVPASSDATNLDALTPNHFLLGTACSVLPSHQRNRPSQALRTYTSLF